MELQLLSILLRGNFQEPVFKFSQCNKHFKNVYKQLENQIINEIKNKTQFGEMYVHMYFQQRYMFNIKSIIDKNNYKLNKIGLSAACIEGHLDLFETMAKKVDDVTVVNYFMENIRRWDLITFKRVMILIYCSNSGFYKHLKVILNNNTFDYTRQIIITLIIYNRNSHVKWLVNEHTSFIPQALEASIKYGNIELSNYLESIYPRTERVLFFTVIENWCQGTFDEEYARSEMNRLLRITSKSVFKQDSLNGGLEIACRNNRYDLINHFIDIGASYCGACNTDLEFEPHETHYTT